jgi:hypothetical protein
MKINVLVACEFSGIVRDACIDSGHNAVSCDFLPTESPGPHYHGDVFDIINDGWDFLIAHPPCTRLANSGVRWLHNPPKGKTLDQMWEDFFFGVDFYIKLRNSKIKKKVIENPVFHKYARNRINPGNRQVVQPWWFGDEAFKSTGFELIGVPELIATDKLIPPKKGTEEHKKWSQCHRESPGPDRWKNRSRTYQGIAKAIATQLIN